VNRFKIFNRFLNNALNDVMPAVYEENREILMRYLSDAASGKEKFHK
jgi:hypothetical protein